MWNTAFLRPGVDWNARDRFSRVCVELFDALVLAPAGIRGVRLPEECEPEPKAMAALRVVPSTADIPIQINRSSPRCGYWDDPVGRAPSDVHLDFVRFFDFGALERRDFEHLEVHVADFPGQPHLAGRRALVGFQYARILVAAVGPA
jgi:hypothetical protein